MGRFQRFWDYVQIRQRSDNVKNPVLELQNEPVLDAMLDLLTFEE